MGRAQAFDTAETVRAARDVFWERGFDGASLPDLERATGLGRSSIYHGFGSKRGLFDAAVESYLDEVIRPRLAPLQADHPEPTALLEYLDGLRTALVRAGALPAENGCLLVNTATTSISHDRSIAELISGYRHELNAALERGVRARLPQLSEAASLTLANACTGLVVAAFALVRVAPEAAAATVDTAIALLAAHAEGDSVR